MNQITVVPQGGKFAKAISEPQGGQAAALIDPSTGDRLQDSEGTVTYVAG